MSLDANGHIMRTVDVPDRALGSRSRTGAAGAAGRWSVPMSLAAGRSPRHRLVRGNRCRLINLRAQLLINEPCLHHRPRHGLSANDRLIPVLTVAVPCLGGLAPGTNHLRHARGIPKTLGRPDRGERLFGCAHVADPSPSSRVADQSFPSNRRRQRRSGWRPRIRKSFRAQRPRWVHVFRPSHDFAAAGGKKIGGLARRRDAGAFQRTVTGAFYSTPSNW